MKEINLIGKTYGKLTVVNKGKVINKRIYWNCKCECGNKKEIQGSHLRSNLTVSCGCSWYSHGKENISWKGYGEIPKSYLTRIKRNAKKRNHLFLLEIKDLWDLFLKQNKKCALTGLPLDFTYGRNQKYKGSASLDRIDSTKGYTIDNIQWVHKDINWMKQDFDTNYFLELCNKVTDNKNKTHTQINI